MGELSDPTFQAKLEATSSASEAALEELEEAIRSADDKSRIAADILNPKPPPAAPEEASPPPPPSGRAP